MSKLKISTREIGSVCVFDLIGEPTQESLDEAVSKITRNIRRHRIQRVILNLQKVPMLEPLGLRRLLAACIRPQRSLLYGVSETLATALETTYVPRNVKICNTEKEVAEDFGPFLLSKDIEAIPSKSTEGTNQLSIGAQLERRRAKRMHVALPLSFKMHLANGEMVLAQAIATNISEGGLYAEFLNLDASEIIDNLNPVADLKAEITIYPSANFPEEYNLQARVVRKEMRKKQLGVAFEFSA
jgi:anti-anti-sigma regulatory factor